MLRPHDEILRRAKQCAAESTSGWGCTLLGYVSDLERRLAEKPKRLTEDIIAGVLYHNSTDDSEDGKWIEEREYRKIARLIANAQEIVCPDDVCPVCHNPDCTSDHK